MVARAWTDDAFRARLLADATAAAGEMGFELPKHHRHLVALENTPDIHNVIVCTQCSCTAFTIIGAAPDWYKDLDYRARVVRQARSVLAEMGLDSARHHRDPRLGYLRRHPLHGAAAAAGAHPGLGRRSPGRHRHPGRHDRRRGGTVSAMDGMHDLGGKQGFGKIAYPPAPHDESWEPLVRALWTLGVRKGLYNMDEYRHAIERMAPVHYLGAPYYERTLTAVASLLVEKGVVTAEALAAKAGGAFPLSRAHRTGTRAGARRKAFPSASRCG